MSNFRGFNLDNSGELPVYPQENPHVLSTPLLVLFLIVVAAILVALFYILTDGYKCNKFKRYILQKKAKQSPYMSPLSGTMSTSLPLYKRDKTNKTSTHMNMFQPNELYKEKFSYEPLEIDNNYRVSFYAVVEQTPTQYI
jgi:hypothetical protein